MKLETNLSVLKIQSKKRWADNWNFRAYLKQHVDTLVVDAAVHRIHTEISAQIDCLSCTNCCRKIQPHLTDADVSQAASALKMSPINFTSTYLKPDEFGEHLFKVKPCPMLNGAHCDIYQSRPEDCSSYPHLHKPDFLEYSISAIENYRICPIVYNVYETLKTAFSYDSNVDYVGDVDQEP